MPKKTEIDHYSDKEALDFHIKGKSGKIEIGSSKPLSTKRDLSLNRQTSTHRGEDVNTITSK